MAVDQDAGAARDDIDQAAQQAGVCAHLCAGIFIVALEESWAGVDDDKTKFASTLFRFGAQLGGHFGDRETAFGEVQLDRICIEPICCARGDPPHPNIIGVFCGCIEHAALFGFTSGECRPLRRACSKPQRYCGLARSGLPSVRVEKTSLQEPDHDIIGRDKSSDKFRARFDQPRVARFGNGRVWRPQRRAKHTSASLPASRASTSSQSLTSPFSSKPGSRTMRMVFAVPCNACAASSAFLRHHRCLQGSRHHGQRAPRRSPRTSRRMQRWLHSSDRVTQCGLHLSRLRKRRRRRRGISAVRASDTGYGGNPSRSMSIRLCRLAGADESSSVRAGRLGRAARPFRQCSCRSP